jgi:CHAD domain-containing protein
VAYRLKRGEPIAGGLKRVVLEEIDSAASHLRGERRASRDEAIHEARKSIKRVRAILKLTRPVLGNIYFTENARLRDIAHKLSGFRDAAALIETFDDLKKKYSRDIALGRLASVRAALVKQKKEGAVPGDVTALLREAESALQQIRRSAVTWPMKAEGFRGIEPGLKETYRRGRVALAHAKKSPHPVNYHEMRKRVKDLWYQVRLIRTMWPGIGKLHEDSLKDLESWLGDDHNLVLLRAGIDTEPSAYGSTKVVDLVLDLVDRHQKKLRDDAIESAAKFYTDKPREYIEHVKHLCTDAPVKPNRLSAA